jgi:hypothetical protein
VALSSKSLFLYGYNITATNCNLDFIAVSGGPVLTATIAFGQYSLTTLLSAVQQAMTNADTTSGNLYSVTADRTVLGGTQNRVKIASSGAFLQLPFLTGPTSSIGASISGLLGFNLQNYTGATSYMGSQTTGLILMPAYLGYNYRDQNHQAKLQGAVNVSAAGIKESVVFNEMYFIDVEFKYEPAANLPAWVSLRDWMIAQAPFDFTPQIAQPTTFYPVTLEKTDYDNKGMGFQMKEMLPEFPNLWQTGNMNMRVVLNYAETTYIT